MTPGAYIASEVKTSRYSLKNVINVEKGVYDSKGKVVNFTIKSNEEGKATFYNVKNTYKDLSHNSIAVNTFKKKLQKRKKPAQLHNEMLPFC